MERFRLTRALACVLAVAAASTLGAACGGSKPASSSPTTSGSGASLRPSPTANASPTQSPAAVQKPVPAESNPPGDIPDSTVFVVYSSKPGGFTIKTPEGWARAATSSSVSFTSSLNSITAAWKSAGSAPTVSSAKSSDVPALQASEPAFRLQSVKSVSLPGGSAVEIVFQENSQPNGVTGKQYRLVVERFEFFKGGTETDLSLSSPVGADNVDPWRVVSESFTWN